ncbi:MAG: transcriptional regulator NrdR [Rhodobacteraceae bacterium]|nr:transcriptional regulator NrdR [Paracoccaceae bacterium]
MRCPFCGNTDTQVRDSRPTEEHAAIRRRRFCPACSGRFTTFERVQLRDLIVIKSDGRREDFDRDKLARSIRLAMNRRHIEPERLDQLITGIVRRLETGGDTDITSKVIGDEVMRALERTDPVGYLRYASVYQNFDSVDDFLKFIENQRRGGDTDDDAA